MAIDVDELVAQTILQFNSPTALSEDSANISSIKTQGTFTLDGQNYKKKFDNDSIYASGVVINLESRRWI